MRKLFLLERKIIYRVLLTGSLFSLVIIYGCGIYTTEGALNPPFSISMDGQKLKFSGYNPEDDFSGYILWYKDNEYDEYFVCVYKETIDKPTIHKFEDMEPGWVDAIDNRGDPENPRIDYTVLIADLKHFEKNKGFVTLYNEEGSNFYFAVSSYGINCEESEK